MARSSHPLFRFGTFGVLILALLLVGCGRKGPLDLPPVDTMQQPAQGADARSGVSGPSSSRSAPIEYNIDGRPLAPRGQKKKLPGDILLD